MGISLPLVALILLATWRMLLPRMLLEGLVLARFRGLADAKNRKGQGVCRVLEWYAGSGFPPLIILTSGYVSVVIQTNKWGR